MEDKELFEILDGKGFMETKRLLAIKHDIPAGLTMEPEIFKDWLQRHEALLDQCWMLARKGKLLIRNNEGGQIFVSVP
jgi:hypothetical protein